LGLLGSLVYVGLTIGSSLAGAAYERFNEKYVIILFTVLMAGSLLFFGFVPQNMFVIYLSRFAIGFFQVFIVIYAPVWSDLMGPEEWKTIWLTIL